MDFRDYVEDDGALTLAYQAPSPRGRDVVIIREDRSVSIHLDGLSYLNFDNVPQRAQLKTLR